MKPSFILFSIALLCSQTSFSQSCLPEGIEITRQTHVNPASAMDYMLSDLNGTLLHRWSANTTSFDISDLPAGVYFFSIRTDKTIHTQKVVKL